MLAKARVSDPGIEWVEADIATWRPAAAPDLIFTNAALQWVPDHRSLLPDLLSCLAPSGLFGMQIPYHLHSRSHQIAEGLCTEPRFAEWLDPAPQPFEILDPDTYYRLLAPLSRRIDIWQTTYWHILEKPAAIVQWMRGTGLRPYLDRLPDAMREEFLAAYTAGIEEAYPAQPDGHALFPFHRIFVLASV
jgi:trans-aconitate 2-methyltransferase